VKFLVDENFPSTAVEKLQAEGHDVLAAREAAPGTPDSVWLARAQQEQRIVISLDKDFGALAFHDMANAAAGVILFRFDHRTSTAKRIARILAVLQSSHQWQGAFWVVDEFRTRQHVLPPNKSDAE